MKYFAIDYLQIILILSCSLFFSFGVNAQITTYPYAEDFEDGWGDWSIVWTNGSSWELGTPSNSVINSAASGSNAWVTNLTGAYGPNEDGAIVSPEFDFSATVNPVVEFSLWWNSEFEWDGVVLQYSSDLVNWQNVGTVGTGINWFNALINIGGGSPGGQNEAWSGRELNTNNGSGGWVTVSHSLSNLVGMGSVYFRLAFGSDNTIEDEGIGFDNFKVSDSCLTLDQDALDLIVSYDSNGNETEIDAWIANNGGAMASGCGEITWSWEIVENQLITIDVFQLATLQCTIQFNAEDQSGGQVVSSTAFLNFEEFPWAGDNVGTGGVLCAIPTYDLKQLSTLDFDSTNFNSSNFNVIQTSGFPGVTSSETIVEFPDTGAGQFSYAFRLSVSTAVPIGSEASIDIESLTSFTINEVTIPFDPGPNITVEVCDVSNINLLELYDELEIILDVDTSEFNQAENLGNVFEPENSWYNESDDLEANPDILPLTEITEPGVYQFNAKKFLRDCAGEPVFVTIVEEVELFAGNNVPDALDDSFYSCGDTVVLNLNSYLDATADLGGRWFDSNNNEVVGNSIEFPDTGAGQFTKSFSYRQENLTCGFFSEAAYDVTYDVAGLSTGTSSTIEICAGTTITEQELLDELGADSGGSWSPSLNPTNVALGTYIYSHGDCGTAGDTSIELSAVDCTILLSTKIYLQGASINPNIGEETLMRDDLRILGILPTTSPYSDGLSCSNSVFNNGGTSGNGTTGDDIVDWVFIELRDKIDASLILYERSALLQRDGSIVAEDGVSDITVVGVYDDYFLAIKHRNHLGIMSSSTIALNGITTTADFTNGVLNTIGTNAQVTLDSGITALWGGDLNGDGQVRYLGPNNDTNFLKNTVVNEPGNNTNSNFYPFTGYDPSDLDMNGQIRYLGPANDTNTLKFIVLGHPSNGTLSNFFPFTTQIPN